jgi:drug/metabolite transporter (DMT)-like permease
MLLVSLDSLYTRAADVSGWTVVFWFGALMSLTMLVYLAAGSRTGPIRQIKVDGWPVVASGLCQLTSSTCFVLAVKQTTIANVVVIVAAAPVLAAVISRFAIAERTPARVWRGIALSIVGIVIVRWDSFGGGRLGGDLLALVAITAFAINLTIWRRFPAQSRPMAMALAGMFMAIVAVGPADVFGHDRRTFALLVLMGVVSGPAGRVALASSTRYLPAAEVGLFAPVETVAAIAWAWLAFDEIPTRATAVGGVIVLLALVYATRPGAKMATVS